MGNIHTSFMHSILCSGYRGIERWTKWIMSYFFIMCRKRRSRMFKYNMKADGDPFSVGFFIPPKEWDLECISREQATDEMFCFGVNSSGECLAMQIARECACDSSSSLYLKIDGYTYTLPMRFNYLKVEDERRFGNNRFYMQCLAPFRKWKIFFNGMLREISPDGAVDRIIHVKITFLWVASSGVFDFTSDYSLSNMADILSETMWDCLTPPIDRMLSLLNEYHQPGMLHGTVKVEHGVEKNIYLWGCRRHSFGVNEDKYEDHSIDIFGNAENGFLFYLKILATKTFVKSRNISGFIMLPNGSLKAARFISVKRIRRLKKTVLYFKINAGNKHYGISTFFYEYGRFFGRGTGENLSLSVVDVIINGVWGSGIAVDRLRVRTSMHKMKCKTLLSLLNVRRVSGMSKFEPLVLTLEDPLCLNRSLSGNLGSSLSKLMQFRDEINGYDLPCGLVITTSGYMDFFASVQESVLLLKENVSKYDVDEMMPLCHRVVEEVSNAYFPADIYDSLCKKLEEILDYSKCNSFHISASVLGSESEVQLLEAYLESFPNVIGLSEIIRCIKKCWASQFSFHAVVCKRSTGQSLNKPMAVIIQKVISFTLSGMISTCETSSGNPSVIEIREKIKECPEATRFVLLKRDLKNHLKISSIRITYDDKNSSKKKDVKLKEQLNDESFLTEEQIIMLGRIVSKMENIFQTSLCIRWCFKKNKFFILQVRLITFINVESQYETLHYCDSYFRTEDDWFSIFNTGEGFLGAVSPLGMDVINICLEIFMGNLKNVNPGYISDVPYFPKFLTYSHHHLMYCMADGILLYQNFSESFFVKTLSFILNFKCAEDHQFQELIYHRYGNHCVSWKIIFQSFLVLFSSGWKSKLLEKQASTYDFNVEDVGSAIDVLDIISLHYKDVAEPFICYMKCTYAATLWSMIVIYILAKIRRDKNQLHELYKDFNFLMCACSTSQEGDIPFDFLALSRRIAQRIDPDVFKLMPVEDAQIWLEDSEINEKVHFLEFLEEHGHRCYKEFDIFENCWSMDSSNVIRVLQTVVPSLPSAFIPDSCPLNEAFNQLPIPPNVFQKLILTFAVPKCVKSLREAKKAKSNLLKVASVWRKAFCHLAEKAVKEFHIPFPEALFFVSLEDIRFLLSKESPYLVVKALKHWESHLDIDKCIFPVLEVGPPSPLGVNYYATKRLKVGSYLKGYPVSKGTTVGTAIVVSNFQEIIPMKQFQKGSILITRTPSIAWSLYFPILGGFATDLGGLLSDGAVSAREFGLPCVINLVRASQVIQTGDRVFLDGNMGVIRRISPE